MWWRFLTFCVLVCLVLFVVLSAIHGRPVVHLFFHRCCDEDIENDHVIFENFNNNFLRERLIDNNTIEVELDEILTVKERLNVHDPLSRSRIEKEVSDMVKVDSDEELGSPEVTTESRDMFKKTKLL